MSEIQNTSKNIADTKEVPQEKANDDRTELFFKDLTELLDRENVKNAIVAIEDPASGRLLLNYRGHNYILAKISIDIAKAFKKQLFDDLTI